MSLQLPHRRALLSYPPFWLPRGNGAVPAIYADFANERYWANNSQLIHGADWVSALGGTFSRSSTAYRTNASGLLESVGSNVLRFDYDPVTFARKGILLEGARTNICLWSQDFTNGSWSHAANISVAGGASDPTGATNAQTLTATGTSAWNASNYIYSSAAGSGTFSNSFYVRRRTGSGPVHITAPNASTHVDISSTLTSAWQRFATVATADLAGTAYRQIDVLTSGDQVDVFGAQTEAGSFASSYIPTTTGSATRAADNLSIPLTLASLYSVVTSAYREASPGSSGDWLNAFTSNSMELDAPFGNISLHGNNSGSASNAALGTVAAGLNKVAGRYGPTNVAGALNGAAAVTGTAFGGSPVASTGIQLGAFGGGGFGMFSQMATFGLWNNLAMSDADLQRLTT